MTAFIIWSVTAVLFLGIGLQTWNQKTAAGFFANGIPPKVKDVKKYNHAVAKLWFFFASVFELLGIPLLSPEQNVPLILLCMLGIFALIIATIILYLRIEKKYKA